MFLFVGPNCLGFVPMLIDPGVNHLWRAHERTFRIETKTLNFVRKSQNICSVIIVRMSISILSMGYRGKSSILI